MNLKIEDLEKEMNQKKGGTGISAGELGDTSSVDDDGISSNSSRKFVH